MFSLVVWPLLVYWLLLFVACYIVVEYGQNLLYDEVTPHAFPKIALGSLILAGLLVYSRTSYDTMLTSELGITVVQAILWFGVFVLVFRFQPLHGGIVGVVMMALVAGLATIAVDSLTKGGGATLRPVAGRPNQPLRRPSMVAPPAVEKAK